MFPVSRARSGLVLTALAFSLQFDPAPRAGEPLVTRRVPDYFLVCRFFPLHIERCLTSRLLVSDLCHTSLPPHAHLRVISTVLIVHPYFVAHFRPTFSDRKDDTFSCTFRTYNCADVLVNG